MRKIEIIDDVRVRFPNLGEDFDLGLEIGAVSVLMAQGAPSIHRELSVQAAEFLRPLAEKFRYVLVATPSVSAGLLDVHLSQRGCRPLLRIVR